MTDLEFNPLKAFLYFFPTTAVAALLLSSPVVMHDYLLLSLAKDAEIALEPMMPDIATVIVFGSLFIGWMGSVVSELHGQWFWKTLYRIVIKKEDPEEVLA